MQAERAHTLEAAHRAKDAVLASVSHDLRTPLTTIKALAHEIAEAGDDRASIIEEEADRLTALVAQLLDLSRLTSGANVVDLQTERSRGSARRGGAAGGGAIGRARAVDQGRRPTTRCSLADSISLKRCARW